MHIDRGLKTVTVSPYPQGYQAPSTAGINTRKGLIQLSLDITETEDFWESHFPEGIALRTRLVEVPIRDPIIVTLTIDSQKWPPFSLYEAFPAAAHASVNIMYEGNGRIQWKSGEQGHPFSGLHTQKLTLLCPSPLYEKCFHSLSERQVAIHRQTLEGHHSLTSPPGEQDIYPLWPYGGFFKPGCRVHEIEQTVFTLSTASGQCEVHLSSLASWHEKPGMIGKEKVRFLMDRREDPTLAGDIERGTIKIALQYGADERGQPYTQAYQSFHFIQNDPTVDIYFKKEISR